jgi:hypothetical protein
MSVDDSADDAKGFNLAFHVNKMQPNLPVSGMHALNYVRGEAFTQRAPSFCDVFGPLITRDFSPVYTYC